jgi:hypothetical protein
MYAMVCKGCAHLERASFKAINSVSPARFVAIDQVKMLGQTGSTLEPLLHAKKGVQTS